MNAVAALDQRQRQLWRPPPRLALSDWADQKFLLPAGDPNAGRWRTLPYQRGIMDAISDPGIERVTWMKSSRVGYTKGCLCATVGYFIEHDPAPILVVQPTIDDAEKHSKEDLAPMLAEIPVLRALVAEPRAKDSGNTILTKYFRGGSLVVIGANSPRGFRRTSRRIVIFDEVDGYPASAGTEGDQIELGVRRTEYYWNRKIIAGSTPNLAGYSRIEELFEQGDQRRRYVPCPQCGTFQVIKFPNLKWPEGRPEAAVLICEARGCTIEHRHKRAMDDAGEWRAEAPEHFTEHNRHASFHLWAGYSYSPNATWGHLAAEFVKATHGGAVTLRTFVNTALGETWKDRGEAPDWNPLMQRREHYRIGTVPQGACFLTAGVDVQKDRVVCFDPKTEVLTAGRGWVLFQNLEAADELATANLLHDALEFQRPTRLVSKWHDGDMIRVESATIDIAVTPDHRMVAYKGSYPVHPRMVRASDLKRSHRLKASVARWQGIDVETITIPSMAAVYPPGASGVPNIARRRGCWRARILAGTRRLERSFGSLSEATGWLDTQRSAPPDMHVPARDFAEFVGWFVSEGHLGLSYSINISQNLGPKADRIAALLDHLPFRYRAYSDARRVVFTINSKALWSWLGRECGRLAANKHIPQGLKLASRPILERLWSGLHLGDGWTQRTVGRKPRESYVTTSRQLADDVQDVLLRLGSRANVSRRHSSNPKHADQYIVSRLTSAVAALKTKRDGAMVGNIRREPYTGMVYCATVPNGTLVCRRNGKIFVAGNCEVVGWGRGKTSWSIDQATIPGDTADLEHGPWSALDALLERSFPHAGGTDLTIRMLAVDSGYNTQTVYAWARRYPISRVIAVKGQESGGPLIGAPAPMDYTQRGAKRHRRGYSVWPVSGAVAKTELYGWLRLEVPTDGSAGPPGCCHFPEYGEEYFRQLTAEQLIPIKTRRGYVKMEWSLIPGRRNDGLDARVYARAAAAVVGLDRYTDSDWRAYERSLGVGVPRPAPAPRVRRPAPEEEPPLPPLSVFEPPRAAPKTPWLPPRPGRWLR